MPRKPDTRWADAKKAGIENPGRDAEGISVRSFKIHDAVWEKAKERAAQEGISASELVRRLVTEYVDD